VNKVTGLNRAAFKDEFNRCLILSGLTYRELSELILVDKSIFTRIMQQHDIRLDAFLKILNWMNSRGYVSSMNELLFLLCLIDYEI
jgi:predicted transcriptional regulator